MEKKKAHWNELSTRTPLIITAICTFLGLSILQIVVFNPALLPDVYRYHDVPLVGGFLARNELSYDTVRILWVPLLLAGILALHRARWIDFNTTLLAMVWPIFILMGERPHPEFFVFPLSLIRIDRNVKFDCVVLAFLAGLFIVTGENNLMMLLNFRLLVVLYKKVQLKTLIIICFAELVIAVIADQNFGYFLSQVPGFAYSSFARFNYLRNVVNPDFSIPETIAIFATSFHFFTVHSALWWIDAIFTVAIVSYLLYVKAHQRVSWPMVICFVTVWISAALVSHGFQASRYYMFFLPILAAAILPRHIFMLAFLAWAHVLAKTLEVMVMPNGVIFS